MQWIRRLDGKQATSLIGGRRCMLKNIRGFESNTRKYISTSEQCAVCEQYVHDWSLCSWTVKSKHGLFRSRCDVWFLQTRSDIWNIQARSNV